MDDDPVQFEIRDVGPKDVAVSAINEHPEKHWYGNT